MAWPLVALMAASAAARVGGELMNRPRRQQLPIEELMRRYREGTLQDINAATSAAGTEMAPALAGRGLGRTSIGPSLLSGARERLTQGGLQQLQQRRAGLLEQQAGLDQQYQQERQGYWPRVLGAAAESGGEVAGALESEAQANALEKLMAAQREEEERRWRELFGLFSPQRGMAGGGYGGGGYDLRAPYAGYPMFRGE